MSTERVNSRFANTLLLKILERKGSKVEGTNGWSQNHLVERERGNLLNLLLGKRNAHSMGWFDPEALQSIFGSSSLNLIFKLHKSNV